MGRALAVSRGRLTWRKLTLLLFHKPVFSIFGQTDFWFVVFGSPQYLVCYAWANFDTHARTPARPAAINRVGEIRVNPLSDIIYLPSVGVERAPQPSGFGAIHAGIGVFSMGDPSRKIGDDS